MALTSKETNELHALASINENELIEMSKAKRDKWKRRIRELSDKV